jgi:hypothetical protein
MTLIVQICRMLQRHFTYAELKIVELRKESPYNDPALMTIVKDEARKIVLSLPLFPGY